MPPERWVTCTPSVRAQGTSDRTPEPLLWLLQKIQNPGDLRLQIPLRQSESWNLNIVQNIIWFSSLCSSGKHRKTTYVQKKAKLFKWQ